MTEIEILLSIDGNQIAFLSIPRSDIERLAVSPFQWLRYVMFAICGARGDLTKTPNGSAVDYENTEIAENTYYYRPSSPCAFVDHQGLNDRITTTEGGTASRGGLRRDIIKRDGRACVITQAGEGDCDAVHLIPHSKGDGYIQRVMRLRSLEDGSASRIDMTENAIFLGKEVHSKLGRGEVALIKTPNHELRPEHIKRFSRGDEREAYYTLQWIKKPENFDPKKLEVLPLYQNAGMVPPASMAHDGLQNVDALFRGTGVPLPPLPSTVIIDYVYGVAAYNAWRSNRGGGLNQMEMEEYRNRHYTQIPPLPSTPPDDINDADVSSGPDDPNYSEYKPTGYTQTRRTVLEETMDELNMFLMYIHGITPEMAAERRQKEIEREEQVAQEASRNRVMEWRNHLDVY